MLNLTLDLQVRTVVTHLTDVPASPFGRGMRAGELGKAVTSLGRSAMSSPKNVQEAVGKLRHAVDGVIIALDPASGKSEAELADLVARALAQTRVVLAF